jgi:hypothetical protein
LFIFVMSSPPTPILIGLAATKLTLHLPLPGYFRNQSRRGVCDVKAWLRDILHEDLLPYWFEAVDTLKDHCKDIGFGTVIPYVLSEFCAAVIIIMWNKRPLESARRTATNIRRHSDADNNAITLYRISNVMVALEACRKDPGDGNKRYLEVAVQSVETASDAFADAKSQSIVSCVRRLANRA